MRSIDEIRHDLPSLSDVPFIHDLPSVSDVTDMVSRLDPRQRRRRSKTPWIIGIVATAVAAIAATAWFLRSRSSDHGPGDSAADRHDADRAADASVDHLDSRRAG